MPIDMTEIKRELRKSPPTLPIRVRLFRWFIRRTWPELAKMVEDKAHAIVTMQQMAKRINALRDENKEWRERAFSAERTVEKLVTTFRTSMREGLDEHNRKHGHPFYHL
jgi:hypothetical protein